MNEQDHKLRDSVVIFLTKRRLFLTNKDTIFLKKFFSIN